MEGMMSGHKPFRELAQKIYEVEIRVKRSTWQRVLLDLFKRDKQIEELNAKMTDRDSEHIRDAEFAGWSQCLESVRGSIEGYPHAGGDTEIMTALDKHADFARKAGREDVLVFLRSFGYSEPPRLSGRGLAAMAEKHLARNDEIRAAGRAQRDKGTIAGSVSYPERFTVTTGRSNGNEDYNCPDEFPKK
jgi:hypothetical protein